MSLPNFVTLRNEADCLRCIRMPTIESIAAGVLKHTFIKTRKKKEKGTKKGLKCDLEWGNAGSLKQWSSTLSFWLVLVTAQTNYSKNDATIQNVQNTGVMNNNCGSLHRPQLRRVKWGFAHLKIAPTSTACARRAHRPSISPSPTRSPFPTPIASSLW